MSIARLPSESVLAISANLCLDDLLALAESSDALKADLASELPARRAAAIADAERFAAVAGRATVRPPSQPFGAQEYPFAWEQATMWKQSGVVPSEVGWRQDGDEFRLGDEVSMKVGPTTSHLVSKWTTAIGGTPCELEIEHDRGDPTATISLGGRRVFVVTPYVRDFLEPLLGLADGRPRTSCLPRGDWTADIAANCDGSAGWLSSAALLVANKKRMQQIREWQPTAEPTTESYAILKTALVESQLFFTAGLHVLRPGPDSDSDFDA